RRPVVIALTMMDLLPRVGQSIDAAKLEAELGVKVVIVDGRTGQGVTGLLEAVRAASALGMTSSALSQLPGNPIEVYEKLQRLLKESRCAIQAGPHSRVADPFTERIDRVVLHRFLGFPIFFIILVGLFAAIFWAAQPLMDGIDSTFAAAGQLVTRSLPDGIATRFLSEGIIHGVGVVAIFFPQVVILFFLMTLLEDS